MRATRRSAVCLVVGLMFGAAAAPAAHACRCAPSGSLERSRWVFVGRVRSVERPEVERQRVRFSVELIYKATPSLGERDGPAVLVVDAPEGLGACGVSFEVGRSYLVYTGSDWLEELVGQPGESDGDGHAEYTDVCFGTRLLDGSRPEELRSLGEPVRAPGRRQGTGVDAGPGAGPPEEGSPAVDGASPGSATGEGLGPSRGRVRP